MQTLAFGDVLELGAFDQTVDVAHLFDSLADGEEVGEHTAGPTLGHVGHVHFLDHVGYGLFGLFLGGHEEDLTAGASDALGGAASVLDLVHRFVKVDDVDAILLHENVGSHGGVPFSLEVSEMTTSF